MKTERDYDAVFQALTDVRKSLNDKLSSLDERLRRGQLECFEKLFQEQKDAVSEYLDGIDQELIKLSVYIEEYQRLHASLKELNEKRIPELGGTPPPMPEAITGDTLEDTLAARIDYLRSQGKI